MKYFGWEKLSRRVISFGLSPATAHPLAALRIGLAAILLVQAYSLAPDIFDLYGSSGILQGALGELSNGPRVVDLTWFIRTLGTLGISETSSLIAIAAIYIGSLVALLVGIRARASALVAWFAHLLFFNSHVTVYGADSFANVFLFYLIWIRSDGVWSFENWSGRASGEATPGTRLGLRVLQLHLCIAYLFSGVEKSLGEQWWNGEAIWRSLMLPLYRQFDFGWLSSFPLLAMLACWGTLVVEAGYPFFIWPKRTRKLWVAMTVSLHLGIAVFLGLNVFGLLMSVFTLALFGFSAEPRRVVVASPSLARLELAV